MTTPFAATVRLLPSEAAALVAGIAEGLGRFAGRSGTGQDMLVRTPA